MVFGTHALINLRTVLILFLDVGMGMGCRVYFHPLRWDEHG